MHREGPAKGARKECKDNERGQRMVSCCWSQGNSVSRVRRATESKFVATEAGLSGKNRWRRYVETLGFWFAARLTSVSSAFVFFHPRNAHDFSEGRRDHTTLRLGARSVFKRPFPTNSLLPMIDTRSGEDCAVGVCVRVRQLEYRVLCRDGL